MTNQLQRVAIVGATGSIGQSTLDVIRQHPERYSVFALSGYSNITQLARDVREFSPELVVVPNNDQRQQLLAQAADFTGSIHLGSAALVEMCEHPDVDIVMAAVVGAAGLESSLAAAQAGKKLLLANKESLVIAGQLLTNAIRQSHGQLLPIDSEHNAIFQCLSTNSHAQEMTSIVLTASGGPFCDYSSEMLEAVTPAQAVVHPNWSMGRKISVDSATLMNKGLELIEACWLFDLTPDAIEVVIHPQSVIHSMVRYIDGSVLAQMSATDMRIPISYGLAYPERIANGSGDLQFNELTQLSFKPPDRHRFPCLRLAEEAMRHGGTSPAILNAANEVAVAAFLNNCIRFTDIGRVNEQVLSEIDSQPVECLAQLRELDTQVRQIATQRVAQLR